MKTTEVAAALAVLLFASSGRAQPQTQPVIPALPPPPPPDPPSGSSPTQAMVNITNPFQVVTPPEVRYDPSPGIRRLLEGLGGLGGGLGLGTLGVLVAIAIQPEPSGDAARDSSTQFARVLMFASVGQFIGQPLGVYLVGRARGGNGGLGWTVLGTWIGNVASSLGILIAANACGGISRDFVCPTGTAIGIGLAAFLSVGGTVLGYELSNDQRHLTAPPPTHVRWSPSITPTQGGLSVGLGLTM